MARTNRKFHVATYSRLAAEGAVLGVDKEIRASGVYHDIEHYIADGHIYSPVNFTLNTTLPVIDGKRCCVRHTTH